MKRHTLFTLFFSLFFSISALAQSLNSVVAVVNDSVITQSDLNSALAKAKQQMAASRNPQAIDDTKLKQMVLQQLIDEKLLLELADRAKMTVSDKQVNDAIQHIADGNHISVAQLKQALAQEGMNFDDYRAMIRKQLLVHQVQQSAVGNQVHVTAADIKAAKTQFQQQAQTQGQQYHVIDAVSSSQKAAEKMMLKMKKGDKVDADDMGWQTVNTLPSLFVDQLKNMSPGDVAGPIKAPNGFHVIKLVAVRGAQNTLSEEQFKNIAYQMQFQKAVEKWLKIVRKTAYIQITGS
ncbi:MAG: SurA N-terminal domain-containing protein [Coxiellaceae bacterium]|nr:SurA N-terminal domain-containing protein [Coxiellaceae bacterium]